MAVKVECGSCKATYNFDEAKIPATGLRVRCPKCKKEFVVKLGKPATVRAPAATPDETAAPASAATTAKPLVAPKPIAAGKPADVPPAASTSQAPTPFEGLKRQGEPPTTEPATDTPVRAGRSRADMPMVAPAPFVSSMPPDEPVFQKPRPAADLRSEPLDESMWTEAARPKPSAALPLRSEPVDDLAWEGRASAGLPRMTLPMGKSDAGGKLPGEAKGPEIKLDYASLPAVVSQRSIVADAQAKRDARQKQSEKDLPQPAKAADPALPAAVTKPAPAAAPTVKPGPADKFKTEKPTMGDLPATRAAKPERSVESPPLPAARESKADSPKPGVAAGKSELPAIKVASAEKQTTEAQKPTVGDLPAQRLAKVAVTKAAVAAPAPDLPAQVSPKIEADLPATAGFGPELPTAKFQKASPAVGAKPAPSKLAEPTRDLSLDLPKPLSSSAAAPKKQASVDPSKLSPLDLPTVSAQQKSGKLSLDDLPMPGGPTGGLPQISDFPSPITPEAALPVLKGSPMQMPKREAWDFGDVELPPLAGAAVEKPSREANLPAVSAGLPARSEGSNLPAPQQGALPARADSFGLPAVMPDFSLPSPQAAGANLPAQQSAGVNLPANQVAGANLPAPQQSLPARSDAFGLPAVMPDFTLPSPMDSRPSPIDSRPAPRPSFATSPGVGPKPLSIPSTELEEADPFPSASERESGLPPALDFGGAPSPEEPHSPSPPPPQGGTEFGEVNLGESTAGSEYGEVDLPGPDAGEAPILTSQSVPPLQIEAIKSARPPGSDLAITPSGRPRPRVSDSDSLRPPQSHVGRVVAILLVVAVAGVGGALELVPDYGAFGRYFILDKIRAKTYAQLENDMHSQAQKAWADDTYVATIAAVATGDSATAKIPRGQGVRAYAAFLHFFSEVRFGADPDRDATGMSLLAKTKPDAPYRTLAEAASTIASNKLNEGRPLLESYLRGNPQSVDGLALLGLLELRMEHWDQARAVYERLVLASPSVAASYGFALALDGLKRSDRAEVEAQKVVDTAPKHAGSRLLLARLKWKLHKDDKTALALLDPIAAPNFGASGLEVGAAHELAGEIAIARGHLTEARSRFEKAIAASKNNNVDAQIGMGEVCMASNQYPQAKAAFALAAQIVPEYPPAKLGIARALIATGDKSDTEATNVLDSITDPKFAAQKSYYQALIALRTDSTPDRAIKMLQGGIKADPAYQDNYLALAVTLAKIGKSADADAAIDQALKHCDKTNASLYTGIANLRYTQKHYVDAVAQFNESLKLEPDDLAVQFGKARALIRMDGDHPKEGKALLDSIEKLDPKYPGLALEMGFFFLKTNQITEALEHYKRALEQSPNDVDTKLQFARARVEAHDLTAQSMLEEVSVGCGMSNAAALCKADAKFLLGRVFLEKGAIHEALQNFKAAVDFDHDNAWYLIYYGWALLEDDELDQAMDVLNSALKIEKSSARVYSLLAEVHMLKADWGDAIGMAHKALELDPQRYEAHATIGQAHMHLQRDAEALPELQAAIAGDPKHPKSAFWRLLVARLHNHQGVVAQDAKILQECVDYASKLETAPAWLPEAYFLLGQANRYNRSARDVSISAFRTFLKLTANTHNPYRDEARGVLAEFGVSPDSP